MKQIFYIIFIISTMACSSSQENADKLSGKWKLTEIIGDSTIVTPDSIHQFLIFEPCSDAYTATCKVNYIYEDASPATNDSVKLNITIKDEQITFINSNIPSFAGTSNFNKIFKLKRFIIKELNEQQFLLERYSDSLHVHASKQ